MDTVNLHRLRHFLRDKPIRVPVLDRSRLVCELVCLEPEQQESRREHSGSDEMYLVLEGRAQLRTGAQIEDLQEMDCVSVPPGVEHFISNPGPGRLTALVMLAPKPSRTTEVRVPPQGRPQQTDYHERRSDRPQGDRGEPELRRPRGNGRPPDKRPRVPSNWSPQPGRRDGRTASSRQESNTTEQPRHTPRFNAAPSEGERSRPPRPGPRGPRTRPPGAGSGPPRSPRTGGTGSNSGPPRDGRPASRSGPPRGRPPASSASRRPAGRTQSGRPGPGRSGPRTSGRP
jgi:mannose-6-phosphate isomerase-like protein (cupin superfamily)